MQPAKCKHFLLNVQLMNVTASHAPAGSPSSHITHPAMVYRDIPLPSWQVVFPDKLLQFRPLDLLRLDLFGLFGVGAALFQARYTNIYLELLTLVSLSVWGTRLVLGYMRMGDRYKSIVAQLLAERTVAGGEGALEYLATAAGLQQFKQTALAYVLLLEAGQALEAEDTAQLTQLIAENAYSEASEDLGAALLRELDPEAVTGLWPEYALLNHSCSPNTVAVVIGRCLLLRTVVPVLKGEELTGSYLGKLAFSPVAVRRAFLSGVYGFHCQCERCLAEQVTFPTVYYPADNDLLGLVDPKQTNSRSNDKRRNDQQLTQEQGLLGRLLQALLGLYVDALERNLQVVDSVARGSEDHIVLALKHLDASRQLHGADAAQCKVAEAQCSRAHAARYGVMKSDPQLLAALISARRRQLLGFSLAQKMSVLAWEASVHVA
eukprot:gene12152-12290_t